MDGGRLVEELRSLVEAARELRQLYEARRYADAHAVRARVAEALERVGAMWRDDLPAEECAEARRLVLELAREIGLASDMASSDPSGVLLSFATFGRRRPGRKPRGIAAE